MSISKARQAQVGGLIATGSKLLEVEIILRTWGWRTVLRFPNPKIWKDILAYRSEYPNTYMYNRISDHFPASIPKRAIVFAVSNVRLRIMLKCNALNGPYRAMMSLLDSQKGSDAA